jgi:hypothetical protein
LDIPDQAVATAIAAARCDLLLHGPTDPRDDPAGFLLDVGELVRLGDPPEAWLLRTVRVLEAIATRPGAEIDAAIQRAERVARLAGDDRAAGDLHRVARRRRDDGVDAGPPPTWDVVVTRSTATSSAGRLAWGAERVLVDGHDLLPAGLPQHWLGVDFEVHGVPTSADSTLSFAVRWHGERPALLWEQSGGSLELTASVLDPEWSNPAISGEALWPAPNSVAG